MSKFDTCHDDVAAALRREGWHVENEAQRRYKTRLVNFDLRASREGQTTFIEVKCFPTRGIPDEQYVAIGQYLTYRTFLRLVQITDPLYLAVPSIIYEKRFDEVMLETLKEHRIKLLIFDVTGERSLQWIEW
jgi:hypothetical protein